MPDGNLKRKQPPTSRRLPLKRAKKLKQTWVENQKIKSKWKAQKRKEGLSSTPQTEQSRMSAEKESGAEQSGSGSEHGDERDEEDEMSVPEEKPAPKQSILYPSRAHIHPELDSSKTPRKRRRVDGAEAPTEPRSLRELTRQAYSRSSLHTFKADLGRGAGARGRGRGRGGARGRADQRGETGRGQPNMKLRMDAMLEKIKQTLA